MTHFLNFGPSHRPMFGISEAGHFKCRVLIDTDEYYALCMHDRLSPKAMCSGSRDLSEFSKISDNMSEAVQDRDTVATED